MLDGSAALVVGVYHWRERYNLSSGICWCLAAGRIFCD